MTIHCLASLADARVSCSDNITQRIVFTDKDSAFPEEYLHFITDYEVVAAPAPGPLLMSAISIFGNESFIGIIAEFPPEVATEMICADPRLPFAYFSRTDEISNILPLPCFPLQLDEFNSGLSPSVALWLSNWHDLDIVHGMLLFSMFYANRVTLDVASTYIGDSLYADANSDRRPPRTIYTSEGHNVQKPSATFASLVVLGILYTLQLIILVPFAAYICRNPSWTRSLDAFSLVRVVASMDKESLAALSSILESSSESWRRLDQMDGLIGMEEKKTDGDKDGSDGGYIARRLTIGGTGALI